MNWNEYQASLISACQGNGNISDARLGILLQRARRLYDNGVPIIFDQQNLAQFLGFDLPYLLLISNNPELYYRHFMIPKRSGGRREIHEPLPELKEMQRMILDTILTKIPTHPVAKAFLARSSVRDNASYHISQPIVLKLDLKDFFESLKEFQVYRVFHNIGYHRQVATLLAKLCCLKGSLPQGAPTSPALSNLILADADQAIFSYCRKANIRYTRYADDLTFSGNFKPGLVISRVESIMDELGLKINRNKTRVMRRHRRQEITGVVVNQGLRASRDRRMHLRQQLYYLKRYGLVDQARRNGATPSVWIDHLHGLAGYNRFINKAEAQAGKAITWLKELKGRA